MQLNRRFVANVANVVDDIKREAIRSGMKGRTLQRDIGPRFRCKLMTLVVIYTQLERPSVEAWRERKGKSTIAV